MADKSTGDKDVAIRDQGYGTDTTQDFGGGEDSDAAWEDFDMLPTEETGYNFKVSEGVSTHKANYFRTQQRHELMLFQRSQRSYHPGLSASVDVRMAWSAYDYEKEQQEAEKTMFPELGIEYSLPASPYDQWRKQNPNEAGHKAWLQAYTTDQERGTKRVHGDMAQELPAEPDSEETQLRAENEESSREDDRSRAAAASEDEEEPYRIWKNCQRALYPSSRWTVKQLR